MRAATRKAIAALGSAFAAIDTIRNSYEIGPVLGDKIGIAKTAIWSAVQYWPGIASAENIHRDVEKWCAGVEEKNMLDSEDLSTMMTLAQGALHAVTDLYERPTTRDWRHDMRPALDLVIEAIEGVIDELRASPESEWRACERAEVMSEKLREVVGW